MFENVIGHEKQKKKLQLAINTQKISHAYLFVGDHGIGKSLIAKDFAKGILDVTELASCPDFKYIAKNTDKKDIVIEQIRKEIIDDVYIMPAASSKKVYIIDDAECLNTASQNAILKTLEEPPKYVCIILIASSISKFLPTILSRVSTISFDGVENELLKQHIQTNYNVDLSENMLEFLNGSIGTAVNLINDNTLEKFDDIEKSYEMIIKKDTINSLLKIKEIDFNNSKMLEYLEYILFVNGKYFCVKYVEKAINRLKYNGNYDIVIDSMMLKIIDNI